MWPEIQQVQEHQRRELVLTGPEICKRIEENGLDQDVFQLSSINFLEISRTSLAVLDDRIGQMRSLNRLVLHYNKLKTIPEAVGKLTKLKFLDVSHNELEEMPDIFGALVDLHSVNASVNNITTVADLSKCVHLTYIDLSHNKLEEFPETLCSLELVNLLEIKLNANELTNVSPNIVDLQGLKEMDLSSNKLTVLPKELALCPKLKEVLLHDNPLKDGRLGKLCTQKPPRFKAILDYIRDNCESLKATATVSTPKSAVTTSSKKKKNKDNSAEEQLEKVEDVIEIVAAENSTPVVNFKSSVQQVRPFVVCCIVKNLELDNPEKLKRFIALQTELHDDICDKRTAATIATHDLASISGNISYEGKPPKSVKIHPLKRTKEITAEELMSQLTNEAENLRKQSKRNTYSGIHKYLNLLHEKPLYPFLIDAGNTAISFPPITNSDKTKIASTTKDVFVEVTSSKSLVICKTVLEKLLLSCLKEDLVRSNDTDATPGPPEATATPVNAPKVLVVQQVRILDETGGLRVVYPSRVDLNLDTGVKVERLYDQ